ncbi:ribosomal protein rps15 [Cystoisospora suis]|uniref:Ribosomal protein rps15 n=1 Tax=Cystoisospora suis TaxID=483139 RepID=A0A2C6L0G7_9APIC|nr:ribosomal protein rps15 [Cystoisospora suis]
MKEEEDDEHEEIGDRGALQEKRYLWPVSPFLRSLGLRSSVNSFFPSLSSPRYFFRLLPPLHLLFLCTVSSFFACCPSLLFSDALRSPSLNTGIGRPARSPRSLSFSQDLTSVFLPAGSRLHTQEFSSFNLYSSSRKQDEENMRSQSSSFSSPFSCSSSLSCVPSQSSPRAHSLSSLRQRPSSFSSSLPICQVWDLAELSLSSSPPPPCWRYPSSFISSSFFSPSSPSSPVPSPQGLYLSSRFTKKGQGVPRCSRYGEVSIHHMSDSLTGRKQETYKDFTCKVAERERTQQSFSSSLFSFSFSDPSVSSSVPRREAADTLRGTSSSLFLLSPEASSYRFPPLSRRRIRGFLPCPPGEDSFSSPFLDPGGLLLKARRGRSGGEGVAWREAGGLVEEEEQDDRRGVEEGEEEEEEEREEDYTGSSSFHSNVRDDSGVIKEEEEESRQMDWIEGGMGEDGEVEDDSHEQRKTKKRRRREGGEEEDLQKLQEMAEGGRGGEGLARTRGAHAWDVDYRDLPPSGTFQQEFLKAYYRTHFKLHPDDCGSPGFQVASLTARINYLTQHVLSHRKDFAAIRGLRALVVRRRKHLQYLARTDHEIYIKVLKALNLKPVIVPGTTEKFSKTLQYACFKSVKKGPKLRARKEREKQLHLAQYEERKRKREAAHAEQVKALAASMKVVRGHASLLKEIDLSSLQSSSHEERRTAEQEESKRKLNE